MLNTLVDGVLSLRAFARARSRVSLGEASPSVYYGFDHIPAPGEPIHGGLVKFQKMQGVLPNSPSSYNVVYLLSSAMLGHAPAIARAAKRYGASVVWNQNGVAFPAWHGPGWERTNAPMKRILSIADHVFYQSDFCREAADRFLGRRDGPSEILYNPIDTAVFCPVDQDPSPGELVLLAAGSHEQFYRVETAVRTLAEVRHRGSNARLIVAGRMNWRPLPEARDDIDRLCRELGLVEHVDVRGTYTQVEAPSLMRSAHILLHTKCNDPCPGLVLEALASGLPVVHSLSGGTPELVGVDAGIGVTSNVTWDHYDPPSPDGLADAVLAIVEKRDTYSAAARRRAVEKFNIERWLDRHQEVFRSLL